MYVIEKINNCGRYGTVYEGKHTQTGIKVAIKKLPKFRQDVNESQNRDMIKREYINWSKVSPSPQVVPLLAKYEDDQHVFFVSELCPYGTLSNVLNNCNETVTKHVCRDMLIALQSCHDRGIAHCDVKPANILCAQDLSWKLVDFGNSHESYHKCEGLYSRRGTPLYTALEVYEYDSFGNNVDIWALGVVTYQMLYHGNHPFYNDDGNTQLVQAIKNNKIELSSMCSDYANDFVVRCLERDKHKRWTAAEALTHPFVKIE